VLSTSNNNKPHSQSQSDPYQCPKCGSSRVRVSYPNIECLSCGSTEALVDFAISWDCHRHYAQYYGGVDLGPNEPLEDSPVIEALVERLEALEQIVSELPPEHTSFKRIWAEICDLKTGLRYTQRRIPRKPTRKKRASRKTVTTEV